MKAPHSVALGFAVFDELITGRIRGKEPRATVDAVRMGRKKMFASSEKAERELGYKVVPVDDALKRAVEWFKTNRYVA
jgi:dihydroflavonol-4-reductase